MSIKANKQFVLSFIEEVFNQHNVAVIPQYLVEGSFLAGHIANWVQAASLSFPNLQFVVEDVIAEGNQVVVRMMLCGTNAGAFFGHPPTGKFVQVSSIHIYKLKEGKIVSYVSESDRLMLYQQLGITPVIEQT